MDTSLFSFRYNTNSWFFKLQETIKHVYSFYKFTVYIKFSGAKVVLKVATVAIAFTPYSDSHSFNFQ